MDAKTTWADLRCTWLDEALWFRSVLEGAGIEALIPDEHTLGLPLASDMEPGTVRLLVRASDLENALELLAANPMPVDQGGSPGESVNVRRAQRASGGVMGECGS